MAKGEWTCAFGCYGIAERDITGMESYPEAEMTKFFSQLSKEILGSGFAPSLPDSDILQALSIRLQMIDSGIDGLADFFGRVGDAGADGTRKAVGSQFPGLRFTAAGSRPANTARQLLDAPEAMHAHGIIHRARKASNILLDAAGRAIVTDFGLARSTDETETTPRVCLGESVQARAAKARAAVGNHGGRRFFFYDDFDVDEIGQASPNIPMGSVLTA
jgi:hypothetical protein